MKFDVKFYTYFIFYEDSRNKYLDIIMLLERKIAAKDKVDKHENEIKTINSKIVYLKRKQC